MKSLRERIMPYTDRIDDEFVCDMILLTCVILGIIVVILSFVPFFV